MHSLQLAFPFGIPLRLFFVELFCTVFEFADKSRLLVFEQILLFLQLLLIPARRNGEAREARDARRPIRIYSMKRILFTLPTERSSRWLTPFRG